MIILLRKQSISNIYSQIKILIQALTLLSSTLEELIFQQCYIHKYVAKAVSRNKLLPKTIKGKFR